MTAEVWAWRQWFDGVVTSDRVRYLRNGLLMGAGAFALGSMVLAPGIHSNTPIDAPLWWRFATLGMVCLGLTLRRLAPLTGLAIGTVGFIADVLIGMAIPTAFIYTDNLYSATLRGPRWLPRGLLVGAIVLSLAAGAGAFAISNTTMAILALSVMALVVLSPIATAMIMRGHRERAELERDRAAKIAELARVDQRVALVAERARMARELHDTIANHFSAIAMRSSAVVARTDMDTTTMREVVAQIRSSSVEGLADTRHSIEMLRADPDSAADDQHRLSDLGALLDRMRSAGLRVRLRTHGQRHQLPVAIEFAAYRIIQEALTNVVKHGHDASVDLRYDSDELVLTIDNALKDVATSPPGLGHGLVGMRERAAILGGEFEAGAHRRGWRVRAILPTHREEHSD